MRPNLKINHPIKQVVYCLFLLCLSVRVYSATIQLGDLAPRGGVPDGLLNTGDLVVLIGLVNGTLPSPSSKELLLGDVAPFGAPDGALNAADLLVLQRAVLGEITLDTIEVPPPELNMQAIYADSSTPGLLTVTGYSGASSENVTITVINYQNGEIANATSDATGAFSLTLPGSTGDQLFIILINEFGVTTSVEYHVGAVQIATPSDSDSINDDTVNVYGTFTGPANTGVFVNGAPACVKGNEFYINNVSLINGVSSISAVLMYQDGLTSSHIIQVNGSVSSHITASVSNNCSVPPLTTLFNIELPNAPIQSTADRNGDGIGDSYYGTKAKLFEIDYDGDGTVDESSAYYISGALQYTFALPGIYESVIKVTDEFDVVHTEKVYIIVQDDAQQDSIFQAVWGDMWTALRAGDKATAMQYLTQEGGRVYGGIFDSLMPYMNETFDELSVIEKVELNNDVADYAVIRLENDVIKTFIINFDRGNDGVWRIDSM